MSVIGGICSQNGASPLDTQFAFIGHECFRMTPPTHLFAIKIAIYLTQRQYLLTYIHFGKEAHCKQSNLARLEAAYRAWNDKKGDSQG
ncbi:hypothetical protein ACSBOB_29570 [Mesorhizobium sp. ASY16-5R]|uniref:hypothetical protein n=1 Tax=Mesorhizobium sp. ASY16-5R TaxID=3445772 RepID=UPI003F9F56A6